jgi:hypothetical protein
MVSIESLLQQLQNGGKKSIKRKPAAKAAKAAKATKPVRARSASPVRRKAKPAKPVKPVKRRVFPKMRRSIGGFFEELNEMVATGPEKEKKSAAMAAMAVTPMAPPAMAMDGGRYRVFKKKVSAKKPTKKPKRRMTFGGYEGEEVAEAEEAEMEQEGGRRRVFKKKPKRRPTSPKGRMSIGGYEEEALGGRRPRPRSASPARRVRH